MKNIIILFSLLISLSACKKQKVPVADPLPPRDNSTINEFLAKYAATNQLFTVTTASLQQIIGAKGTTITIPALAFKTKTGTVIQGNIDLKLIEVYGKKDMIYSKAQSATKDDIFISAGQIKFTAKQGDEDLYLISAKTITVNYPTTTTPGTDYTAFFGHSDLVNNNNIYQADTIGIDNIAQPFFTPLNYQVVADSLDWISCGRFTGNAGAITGFSVNLIGNFNINNTEIFVVYPSAKGVGYLNKISEQLYSNTYKLAVGTSVTIVALSKINGRYFSSYKTVAITGLLVLTLDFTETNEADIIAKIATL